MLNKSYKSGFSVMLLTIIISAVGVAVAISALSDSTQIARTNINVKDASISESKARGCVEKVFAKLRAYRFYGGDETFEDGCRVYTISGIENGTRIIKTRVDSIILETKITQINPKIVIEYQKQITNTDLDPNNPYVVDPLALRLWLKADRAETNNGQPVLSVKNATDDLIDFAQKTDQSSRAPKLITNAINNRPALRFDGTDDFLTSTTTSIHNNTASTGGLTVIVAGKSNSISTNQTYISKFNAPNNKREWRLQNDDFIATDSATAEQPNEIVSFDNNNTNTHIIAARWAPSTASSININNTAADNATASFADITSTDTPIIVGGQQQGGSVSELFKGDIAEILVYQKRLSDAELNAINSYLNNKYRVY